MSETLRCEKSLAGEKHPRHWHTVWNGAFAVAGGYCDGSQAASSPAPKDDRRVANVSQVRDLLGVDVWDAPSFRADVRIDFDEHGRILAASLLNGRAHIATALLAATAPTPEGVAALLAAADEMEMVIAEGDCADLAAPVPGEVGRATVAARRNDLYEEPATWLREYAATFAAPTPDEVGLVCQRVHAPEDGHDW